MRIDFAASWVSSLRGATRENVSSHLLSRRGCPAYLTGMHRTERVLEIVIEEYKRSLLDVQPGLLLMKITHKISTRDIVSESHGAASILQPPPHPGEGPLKYCIQE